MAGPFEDLFGSLFGTNQPQQPAPQDPEIARRAQLEPFMPPRAANPQGSLTGLFDRMNGVPTQDQIAQGLADKKIRETSIAHGNIMRRLTELKEENPNLPPGALQQMLHRDPVWNKNILDQDPAKIMDTVMKTREMLFGEDKSQVVPEGSALVTQNQTTGQGPRQVYQNPKTQKPWEVSRAIGMRGDDPRLKGHDLPKDKHFEVTYKKDAFGEDYIHNISSLSGGVNIDLGEQAQTRDLQSKIEGRNKLVARQQSVMDAVRMAQRIEDQLDQGGAGVVGLTGLATRVGQAISEQVPAALRTMAEMGISNDPNSYKGSWDKLKGLNKGAALSAATQSNLLALAFKIAQANSRSGNVTAKEVEQAIDEIGGKFGSTVQLRSALREVVGRTITSFDDAVDIEEPGWERPDGKGGIGKVKRMRDMLPERGLGQYIQRPSAGQEGGPGGDGTPTRATGSVIPRGFRAKNPKTGMWMLFNGGTNTPDNWSIDPDQTDR